MANANASVSPSSVKKILLSTFGALVVAVALLFGAILPAEYGLDPLGTGSLLGLTALGQEQPISTQPGEYRVDSGELSLYPAEWVEYFYRLDEGSSMLFSWEANGPVEYNFHAAPDGAPPGYAESFDAQAQNSGFGAYTAPFDGIHGWYWENVGTEPITISISTAGFYLSVQEGRARASGFKDLTDLRGNPIPRQPEN